MRALPTWGKGSAGRPTSAAVKARSAFSLIEVMLAMGVITFAAVTAVGVIPVGLTTLRQAMDDTVESQIIRSIGARTLVTPYSQMSTSFAGTRFYYDEEGTFLTNSPATRPLAARYCAVATLAAPTFPGSAAVSTGLTNSLMTVRIQLTAGPNDTASTTNFYSLQAPNSGS